MTFADFISAHPWWTTIWLLIICSAIVAACKRTGW